MRTLFTFLLLSVITSVVWSQPYGNEWVNHDQTYYKFPIYKTGVHRITYQAMLDAGFPINSISSNRLQVFGKEKEVPLYVNDGGDNIMNAGDYIEFYSEKNDGWLDSLLYDVPKDIGNPGYSLYNDTLYYFLTWKSSGNGKRYVEETDVNFSIYSPAPYVLEEVKVNYNSQYYGGYSQLSSYSSFFSKGEGWGGPNYNGANNYTLQIPFNTPNVYTGPGAPDVVFHAKSNSNSNANYTGLGNHHTRWEIGQSNHVAYDKVYIGFQQVVVDTTFSNSLLSNGTTNVKFKIIGDQGATTDYQSVSYVSLKYPRTTATTDAYIDWIIPKNTAFAKSRIDISGASLTSPSAYIIKGGTARRIPFVNNGGVWQGLVPNVIGPEQRLIVASSTEISQVLDLKAVNGNGKFVNYENISAESAYIIVYNKSMQTSANHYANYRKSVNGGGYNVVLMELNDLWLQYGGGVPKHILGIRRAVNHIYNNTTNKPVALFIAGKGISEANDPNVSGSGSPRKSPISNAANIIPSYGNPSSDLCITAKWNGSNSYTPAIPTGRIAAKNDADLELYLGKVQIYEAAQNQNSIYNKPNKEWQKQIIHFGGGQTSQEQSLLQSYLNGMKNSIQGANYGGNVHSYFKQTTDPFNPIQSQEVNSLLENGVSLITFFGHATADGFDQNIDDPANWGNAGKYPVVIGNGCYTGDIFKRDFHSTSENFVLINDLGAIAFLSASKLGYTSYLNIYSSEMYRQMSIDNYGETLGKQVQEAIRKLELANGSNFLVEVTAMQFILHGDPAVKLNWHKKPEIDLTEQDVFFGPTDINLAVDSITVTTVLTNLGKSILDTFDLTIVRNFPSSNIDSIYHIAIPGLHYKDTFTLTLPLQATIGAGLNQFSIMADIPSFIPEQYDEYGNNQIVKNFFVNIGGIIPVWPYDYAVVPRDSVVVKASTVNPLAPFNTYRFELDTTDLYNSPFKRYAIVQGLGGVKEVHPHEWLSASSNMPSTLVLEDSVSYFWRVGIDSSEMEWREHSFQYIPNKRGWGQAHFFQFKNGGFSGVDYDRPSRTRKFIPQNVEIHAQVYDNANADYKYNGTLWNLNGILGEYGICTTTPSIHVAVVDPVTLEPWGTSFNGLNPDHNFGNANNGSSCRNRVDNFFIFRQNSASQLSNLRNMLENEIPDGYIVLVYTAVRAQYPNWQNLQPELFQMFQDFGATGMSPTSSQRAFITMFRKGDPASAETVHAQEAGEFISLTHDFITSTAQGVETSTTIGPALNWRTLYWKQDSMENPNTDSTRLVIRGLNYNQQVELEIDTVFTANDSILNLNALVPANQYPYLQLRAKYFDPTSLTPAQVNRWHVLYDDVPEAAIDGSNGFVFMPQDIDSLKEGTEVTFAIDVKNISDLPMDSLLVHYWVVDKNQVKHPIPYTRQDSLRVNEVLRDTVKFNSIGLSGLNTLWMEVNPYVKGPNNEYKDQPELAHFNNILQISFELSEDDINPILDVTFDGEHILNGDIVSPFSEILISLQDENPFLVMNEDADTSNFGIYLTYPSGEQKRIPFIDGDGNEVLQWIPANESNLRFKILYNTEFKENGTYELLVQGSDKAGNLSGDLAYRIKFDVMLESSISYLMNYPNPFSTSTRFVFTLTGSEVPDDMIIQIMTVTGRIVREITEDELGPIRIGRNITEYAWDGRDEFGDQLANGVYLYRVKARINGEDIEHRSTGADKYFKKNWGKMYLMR